MELSCCAGSATRRSAPYPVPYPRKGYGAAFE